MSQEDLDKWLGEAMAQKGEIRLTLSLPLRAFLREVVPFADKIQEYWTPLIAGIPALSNNYGKLPVTIEQDIRSLRKAIKRADDLLLLIVDPKRPVGLIDEAINVRNELEEALVFVHDDGVQELADDQLAKLLASYQNDDDTITNLSDQLSKLASFGELQRAKLVALGTNFDITLLERAAQLSDELAALPLTPLVTSPESKAALDRRNRLVQLLSDKIDAVRGVVKFLYRKHPNIQDLFYGTYQRRRASLLQRRKATEEQNQQVEQTQQAREQKKAAIREMLLQQELVDEVKREIEQEKLARGDKK